MSDATAVQFYHLTVTPVEKALPKLLEKALASGKRVLVIERADEKREYMNQTLWTYHPNAFLPHGSTAEPQPENQPVLLSPTADNLNRAEIVLTTDGTMLSNRPEFERILDMFDGNSAEAAAGARTRWDSYKNSGHAVSYLRQNDTGGWEEQPAS